tara:strand:+ start:40 stop:1161 length:1122 start_codon:yes stop_codon:yes gene_type:complete
LIIYSKPEIEISFLRKNFTPSHLNLNLDFTFDGRTALEKLAIEIGLKSGDKILIPGFICYSAIKPIINLGVIPIYYDINLNLTINWSNILIHLEKNDIKCILLVNYFGFIDKEKTKIIYLCEDHKLKVIDDYCHSFLSYFLSIKTKKTIHGENVAFNLNKTLRTKCGAYVCKSSKKKNFLILKNKKILLSIFYFIIHRIELINKKHNILNINSDMVDKLKNNIKRFVFLNNGKKNKSNNKSKSQIKKILAQIISNKNYLNQIKKKRIDNYLNLYRMLKDIGIEPIQKIEDLYSVPQVLAISDKKGKLNKYLRLNGIGSYKWPDIELPSFTNEQKIYLQNTLFLQKSIVCLPIHQSINMEDMKYIVEKIKDFYL